MGSVLNKSRIWSL